MGHCIVPEAEKLLDREIPVLDHGFVRLVDYMGSDQRIVQTARVSYGQGTRTVREDAALIDYLMRHQHTSPFEHVILEFHCKLPIFVARQWIRHRTARLNEISGRYSVVAEEFYVPPEDQIKLQNSDNKQGRSVEEVPPELRKKVIELLKRDHGSVYAAYQEMLMDGVARELARVNLPLSTYTQWYWQMDLHNLFHFIALRLDPHAQWEIRQYAEVLYRIAKAVAPCACESFERHVVQGKRLSRDEVDAVRKMLSGERNPLTGRRLRDFEEKLGLPGTPPAAPVEEPVPGGRTLAGPSEEPTGEKAEKAAPVKKPPTEKIPPAETPESSITSEEINALPLKSYTGPIRLIRTDREMKDAVKALKKEKLLGFDTETRPAFRKGESYQPALLQLAAQDIVYIFQLRFIEDIGHLFSLLAEPAILKVGVALEHDVRKLRELAPFVPAGFVDLADISTAAGVRNNGLRGLAALLLGIRISKGAQRSNWARDVLSPAQEAYAATDAWVSREIYLKMEERRMLPAAKPSR